MNVVAKANANAMKAAIARKNSERQVSERETEEIVRLAEASLKVSGDFVELGCYKGDTSLLLQRLLESKKQRSDRMSSAEPSSEKKLWIYDSFEGLPAKTTEDSSSAGEAFQEKELFVTKREVVERFKRAGLRVPIIKKGFFEKLSPEVDLPGEISFAFLDGDLYQSIKTSLELVFPKLAGDGLVLVHDYNNPQLPGSAKAVDEFLKIHPEFKLQVYETLAILKR